MSESARDLLVRGISAAKANDKREARFYLEWALRMEPSEQQRLDAYFWLSEISDDQLEKRDFLENVLAYQPNHHRARRSLAILDGRLSAEDIVDPDRISQEQQDTQVEVAAQRFFCQTCGGRLTFTPDGQVLICEYCDLRQALQTEVDLPGAPAPERDFTLALATARGHTRPMATPAFACQACGASFVVSTGTLSLTCPYCASVYVIEDFETRQVISPDGILPFVLTEEAASQAVQSWLASRRFEESAKIGRRHGLYVPIWVFRISGEVTWTYSELDRLHVSWAKKSGHKPIFWEAVCIPACTTIPGKWSEEFNRFALEQLLPYEAAYLANFPAQIYQISIADASLKAREKVLRLARAIASVDTSEQVKDFKISSSGILVESYRLILAPVWTYQIVTRSGRDLLYVNGQNGGLFGGTPAKTRRGWLYRLFN